MSKPLIAALLAASCLFATPAFADDDEPAVYYAVRHVPGTLYPVNSIGLSHVPNLFARNERVVVHQRSERHGRVASVMVGAIGVGRISLAFDESVLTNDDRESGLRVYGERAPLLSRGDELGTFHLGSTVIVLIAPDQAAHDCYERNKPPQRKRRWQRC